MSLSPEIVSQIETLIKEYTDTSTFLSVKECSEYLRQCKKTTYTQILKGKIQANRVGNKYLIPKKQFIS